MKLDNSFVYINFQTYFLYNRQVKAALINIFTLTMFLGQGSYL